MPYPSKYDAVYCDELIKHMKTGYSFESFGGVVMVSKQTLYTWADKHKEFKLAKDLAETVCQLKWEEMGMEGLKGQIEGFNATIWIFNMKNRFKWRDRHDIQHEAGKSLRDLILESMKEDNDTRSSETKKMA